MIPDSVQSAVACWAPGQAQRSAASLAAAVGLRLAPWSVAAQEPQAAL